jgi:mannose-1-phosphate guanylyltransferase
LRILDALPMLVIQQNRNLHFALQILPVIPLDSTGRSPGLDHRVQGTEAFLEKPSPERCRSAMGSGALWNTMVIAAKVETLWALGLRCFPEMMRLFVYAESIGGAQEHIVLEGIYQAMPSRNFSSHLLQEFPRSVGVMELQGVLWSDWGRLERIAETLRRLGREPRFCWAHTA